MRRLFSAIALALLASASHAASRAEVRDAGPAVDRNYDIGTFDRIEVAGPYDVTVTSGGTPGVTARGGAAILDETEVIVENGVLKIRPRNRRGFRWSFGTDNMVRVAVSAVALRGAAIAGSGGVRIDRVGSAFKGAIAGSGDLTLDDVDASSLDLSVAGSGDVRASGKVERLEIKIAGSGDVDVSALEAAVAGVSIAGSGNVRARATATADVSIMGSGDVEMTGGAACSVSKRGSGDVRCS